MLAKIEIDRDGDVYFYNENDEPHRLDGPAVEHADGTKSWFIHNKRYSEKEFNEIVGEIC